MIDARLYLQVVALFGALTVRSALARRAGYVGLDPVQWGALVSAYARLATAKPDDRRAVCLALDEPTRRALVLVLLDFDYLADVARAALDGNGCAADRRE